MVELRTFVQWVLKEHQTFGQWPVARLQSDGQSGLPSRVSKCPWILWIIWVMMMMTSHTIVMALVLIGC